MENIDKFEEVFKRIREEEQEQVLRDLRDAEAREPERQAEILDKGKKGEKK